MQEELATRGLDVMRAYVTGEGSLSTLLGGLKGLEPEDVGVILTEHRAELYALDPARSVILESVLPTHSRRHT